MPQPRFEVPVGAVDGINLVYSVSTSYKPGTTAVFVNGLLQEQTLDDGWAESDPVAGEVTMKEAPRSTGPCPDIIQIFFLDTSPVSPETEITPMEGKLTDIASLNSILIEETGLFGVISPAPGLSGAFLPFVALVGRVQPEGALSGVLELCGE